MGEKHRGDGRLNVLVYDGKGKRRPEGPEVELDLDGHARL